MSPVIKSAGPAAFTALHRRGVREQVSRPEKSEVESVVQERDAQIVKLEAEIAERVHEAAELRADVAQAFTRGEAQGIKKGHLAADSQEKERLVLIAAAVDAASEKFSQTIKDSESLAAVMARACLDKLFADQSGNGARVEAILRRQLETVERGTMVAVAVSSRDFDETALGDLRATLGSQRIVVELDPDLPSGGCRLRPLLGEIDIGLDTQWSAVRRLLDSVASQGRSPC